MSNDKLDNAIENLHQKYLPTFKKRMQDFDFALLNINERYGDDLDKI